MKKIKHLIICSILLILMIPTIVNAEVGPLTTVGLFDTIEQCRDELEKNDYSKNSNATNGYYLSCIEVSCVSNQVSHHDIDPFEEFVTCANGNKNPYVANIDSAIARDSKLTERAVCSLNEDDENYLQSQYATKIDQFNCLLNKDGSVYSSNSTTTTTTAAPTGTDPNPQTGINTYYMVLGSTVILLSIGLYIINKKNLFKKI